VFDRFGVHTISSNDEIGLQNITVLSRDFAVLGILVYASVTTQPRTLDLLTYETTFDRTRTSQGRPEPSFCVARDLNWL
jgi:hypothetical protein